MCMGGSGQQRVPFIFVMRSDLVEGRTARAWFIAPMSSQSAFTPGGRMPSRTHAFQIA